MFCTNCGKQIEDGADFCTNCGEPVRSGEERSTQSDAASPCESGAKEEIAAKTTTSDGADDAVLRTEPRASSGPSKKGMIVGAAAAGAVLVIAALCFAFGGFSEQRPANEGANVPIDATIEESEAPTFESECFQIFLPEDIADVVSFTEKNNTVSIEYAPSGVVVATLFPQGEALVTEAAKRSYDLGEVYLSGHYEEALLKCVYIDADGKTTHWGSKQPRELAVEELLGISCEDLIGCIYLNTGSEFVEAHADLSADDGPIGAEEGSSDTSVMAEGSDAVPTEPFWGIWVGASKNEAEMTALAQRLKDEGVSNGVVIKTTDWSNLNPEPWWVVSAGAYASEEAANSALSDIKQRGYSNAYVKHTGSKR